MSSVSAPIARDSRAGTLPAWRRGARPYLLVLPAIALTIGILYPFVLGAMYAFQNYRANRPDSTRWVGLENFQDIFSDPSFSRRYSSPRSSPWWRRSRPCSGSAWHCCWRARPW